MRKLEPIKAYQLERRLQMLSREDYYEKEVLEIGIFKGDHLKLISHRNPKSLFGVADNDQDLRSAQEDLKEVEVSLGKIKDKFLPFPRQSFQTVFSVTFFQFITDRKRFDKLFEEACRASDYQLIIIESTAEKVSENNGLIARTAEQYTKLANRNNFQIIRLEYINAEISTKFSAFLNQTFGENNQPSELSVRLQKLSLPFTKMLDSFFPAEHGVTKMVFQREKDELY